MENNVLSIKEKAYILIEDIYTQFEFESKTGIFYRLFIHKKISTPDEDFIIQKIKNLENKVA